MYKRCPDCKSRIISEKACHSCGKNFHASSGGGGSSSSSSSQGTREQVQQLESRRREILGDLKTMRMGEGRVRLRQELEEVDRQLSSLKRGGNQLST